MNDFKDRAEEHWKFLERWLHIIYVDAMLHGYGHGYEDAINMWDEHVCCKCGHSNIQCKKIDKDKLHCKACGQEIEYGNYCSMYCYTKHHS